MLVPRPVPWGRLVVAFTWLLSACTTREVPQHYPESSAASANAPAGKAADVTSALVNEPGGGADASAAAQTSPQPQHGGHQHAH